MSDTAETQRVKATSSRRLTFGYLFALYFILGGAETMISPLFPLLRDDLQLDESHQAVLLAVVAAGIASFNLIGGASTRWLSERSLIRLAAAILSIGMLISGTAQSFAPLLIGQACLGVAFGLFFPPALAAVTRSSPEAPGKAIAIYGLAYSFGLASAALSGTVGQDHWRWVFILSAIPGLATFLWAPRWSEPEVDSVALPLLAQLWEYSRVQAYRLAGLASFGGVSMHYVVIGFAPVYFVDAGVGIGLVASLIAIGRVLSAPVKLVGGALYDRRGGPWTARLMMSTTSAIGLLVMLLPPDIGVFFLIPFVGVAVSVLPVANAMLVAALPPRAGWGIGTFRAALLGSAALLAGAVSLLLRYLELEVLMIAVLTLPALIAVWLHRAVRSNEGGPAVDPAY